MDRVRRALFDQILGHWSQPETLLVVNFDLLLQLFCPCIFHVLSEDFEFFVAFCYLVLELSDLLLQGHHQKCLLLVFVCGLSKRKKTHAWISAHLLFSRVWSRIELILAEEVLDGLLLARELILKNLDFGLEFDGIFLHLVVQYLHFDGFVVKLLLLFGV